MDSEDTTFLEIRLPRLTSVHWTAEFKEAFQELALNYGEAGDIIIAGQDIQLQNPGQYDDLLPMVIEILSCWRRDSQSFVRTRNSCYRNCWEQWREK
jgi:hypothetical protein